jgi:polyphosphate kinase
VRFDAPSPAALAALAAAPLPGAGPAARSFHRDLYLDTADDALRARGAECRLRFGADDRQTLLLQVGAPAGAPDGGPAVPNDGGRARRVASRVRAGDAAAALAAPTAAGRQLRALVDPARLEVRLELEVERWARAAAGGWLRRPRAVVHLDQVVARRGALARAFQHVSVHALGGAGAEAARLAEAIERDHGLRRATAGPRGRGELLLKWAAGAGVPNDRPGHPAGAAGAARAEFLNPELSLLAFQERVLAVAEDARTPLRERLRFLAIVTANLDEFYMVRVAGLRRAAREQVEEQADDGLDPAERLDAIRRRARALAARQARCFDACLVEAAARGTRVRAWADLDAAARAAGGAYFREHVLPALTPLAMTLHAGHPAPHVPHLSLAVAALVLGGPGEPPRFAEVELPAGPPRFVPLGAARAGGEPGAGDVVALEELVRAHLGEVYAGARVEHAAAFRVTRGGDLAVPGDGPGSLLDAVAEAARRRARNAVVRVEVERGAPAALRLALVESLRREQAIAGGGAGDGATGGDPGFDDADVEEADGPLDLGAADALPLPADPALEFPPFRGARPLPAGRPMLDVVGERDVLAHHPFDRFSATVGRFFREAADDPDVVAVKATLYRVGDASPVVEALLDAARRGARVVAFVELQARFDEDRNVRWARALEAAGGRVVYGLAGYKTHAKLALVVRREAAGLRSYVHVGTGNYNARTARLYTDLSLFSADPALAGDAAELFNALTGSSHPPRRLSRAMLAAPHQLLPALLERIAREAAHARAGREARITVKVNGLSDADVVRALYQAARDGVRVELVVRGVCTLRPGVPGLSEGIRVVSTVGRFLEHSRAYRFANGGSPEYFVGSADLRPRNLRQRVELLAPVRDAACRATLDRVFARYLDDPGAWELTASGAYRRRDPDRAAGSAAQEAFAADATAARAAARSARGAARPAAVADGAPER